MGYGEYKVVFAEPLKGKVGRRTMAQLLRSCAPGYISASLWGHNRLKVTYADRVEYRLHDTPVVTRFRCNHTIVVDDGGWRTRTTTAAIQQALAHVTGKPCNAWRKRDGRMFVRIGDCEHTDTLPLTIQASLQKE